MRRLCCAISSPVCTLLGVKKFGGEGKKFNAVYLVDHQLGIKVFAEVAPDSMPPRLRRRLSPASFCFAFELRARNTALLSITELPTYRPARQIFCFDNLREEVVSSRPLLGPARRAAVRGARGPAPGPIFRFRSRGGSEL